ncbi:MAG: undecaprenyl-phosphate glucose phosphotransferase, partial [Tannerella sp.]|nr:undecaprenyl-phosphate glucose phosphotransferase [Tannerella sp.]
MGKTSKQTDLLQWIIGIGDLCFLNLIFFVIYYEMDSFYTSAITHNLKEVVLLLNFCYFFAAYFYPIKIHVSVVFLEKIVQWSFMLITFQTFLFGTCLIFLNAGNDLATFIVVYYVAMIVCFSLWRVMIRVIVKLYRRKGYNTKNIIIIGAGKNGMELYKVIKTDLSYGFNVLGFFDDNELLRDILPNYLGRIDDMETYAKTHSVDEIYCTIPGTNSEKISELLSFAEKNMIRFFIIPDFYRDVKKSMILEIMESVPLLSIRIEPLQSPFNRFIKRTFDIVFSLLVLIIC